MHRHEISDDRWERIKDLLPGQPGDPGVTAKDNRLFVNAVLWIAKTGAPLRDLPERFGPWNSVWKRFDRRAKKGVWKRIFETMQEPDLEWVIIDSTVVRAHQHAAGAVRKGGGDQALGRSRGGFGTKIHIAVDALGNPVDFILTGGQEADVTQAEPLIDEWRYEFNLDALAKDFSEASLDRIYSDLVAVDFSKDVLSSAAYRLLVVRDAPSGWTDFGSPQRALSVLKGLGHAPPEYLGE